MNSFSKPIKHKYGEYGWVQLTDKEYQDLKNLMGEAELKRCIEYIDSSAESTGNKNHWKGWKEVIRKCYKNNWGYNYTQKRTQSKVATNTETHTRNLSFASFTLEDLKAKFEQNSSGLTLAFNS